MIKKQAVKLARMLLVLSLLFTSNACQSLSRRKTHHVYFMVTSIAPVERFVKRFEQDHPDIEVHIFYGIADENWARHYDAALLYRKPGRTDLLQDLTPFLETDKTFDAEDILPGLLAAAHDRNRLVVLPLGMDFSVLLFDAKQFSEADVPLPTDHWTWDDLLNAAWRIDRYKKRTSAGSALSPGGAQTTLLYNWLAMHVHPYREVNGKYIPCFNAPETQKFIMETRKSGLLSLFLVRKDAPGALSSPLTALTGGKTAMTVVTFTQLRDLLPALERHPDISFSALPQPVRFGDGDRGDVFIEPVVAMSRGSNEKQATWAWLSFLSKHYLFPHSVLPARRSLMDTLDPFATAGDASRRARLARVFDDIMAGQRLRKEDQGSGAKAIVYRYFADLLFATSADESKQARAGVSKALADWYAGDKNSVAPFTITPPVSVADLRKQQLRVFDMNLYGQGAEALLKPFQRTHSQWLISFWPISSSADAVAVFANENTLYEPPGLFPTPLLPVNDIAAVSPWNRADFLPQAFNISWRRQLPGIPVALSPVVLYYDPSVFTRWGVTQPRDGWTVDDMLSAAGEVADKNPQLLVYAPVDGYETAFLLDQQGTELFTPSLSPRFADASVLKALDRIRHLGGGNSFFKPSLEQPVMEMSGPYRYVPSSYVPVALTPRAGTRWPVSVFLEGVNKESEHADMAWQWAAFAARHPEMVKDALPALESLAESDATRARLGAKRYDAYMTMLKRIPARPLTDEDILRGAALWWFDRALRRVGPETDLRSVLEPAQAKAQAFLTCTGGRVEDIAQLAACARRVDPDHPLARTAP